MLLRGLSLPAFPIEARHPSVPINFCYLNYKIKKQQSLKKCLVLKRFVNETDDKKLIGEEFNLSHYLYYHQGIRKEPNKYNKKEK